MLTSSIPSAVISARLGLTVAVAATGLTGAAMLVLADGQPLKVSGIVWVILLAAGCFPVSLYFPNLTERLLLFGLALTLPVSLKLHLLFRAEHLGGAIGLRVSITEILVGLIVAACAWRWMNTQGRASIHIDTPIFMAFLAYLGCAAISTLFGAAMDLGVYQISAVVEAFLAFVFVTNYVTTARRFRICVIGIVASLTLQSAIAITQAKRPGLLNLSFLGAAEEVEDTVEGSDIALPDVDRGTTRIGGEIEHRPSGLLIHANLLAAFLVLSIPVAVGAWAVESSLALQVTCLTAVGLGAVAIYFSMSRSGWAGLILALVLLGVFWWRLPLVQITAMRRAVVVLVLVVAAAGLAMQAQKLYLRLTETAGEAIDFRRDLALTAWNMAKANPAFGVGLNSFTEVAADYETSGMSRLKNFPVHNVFLLELSEGGFTTGIAFVGLVGTLLFRMFRTTLRSGNQFARTVGVFAACGICGFWLTQISDYVYRIPILTTLVWFQAGLVIAAANLQQPEARD